MLGVVLLNVVVLIVMLGIVMLNAIALSTPLVLILSSVETRAICAGAPTFSITTLSITPFSTMTLTINDNQHKLH